MNNKFTSVIPSDITGSADDVTGKAVHDAFADHDSHATDHMEGEAGDVNGSCESSLFLTMANFKDSPDYLAIDDSSRVMDFHDLQSQNRQSGVHSQINVPYADIVKVMEHVINNLSPVCLWQLVHHGKPDTVLKVLYPIFSEYFMRTMRTKTKQPTHVLKALMHGSLETLILCFQSASAGIFNGLAKPQYSEFLVRTSFRPAQAIEAALITEGKRRSDLLIERAHENYWQRRDQAASPTRDVEARTDISHLRKTHIFLNGVAERNKAGAHVLTIKRDRNYCVTQIRAHYAPLIEVRRGDPPALNDFFEANPHFSPHTLLTILDECVKARIEITTHSDQEGFESFFPEKGCRISFLLNHINDIQKQLRLRYKARGKVWRY